MIFITLFYLHTATQLIDEFTETVLTTQDGNGNNNGGGRSNKNVMEQQVDEIGRRMVTPTQASSLIAFMNLYNAQPVAFSAGGLFVFSKGLIMMIVSIIVSYLIFLLQVNK